MLRILEITLVALFGITVCAHGQSNWIRQAGGISHDECMDLSVDSDGNIYTCGYFNAGADFQGSSANSAGLSDAFIAKWNDNGDIEWLIQGGGAQPDRALAIATNDDGFSVITGYATGDVVFGTTFLTTNSNSQDIFLMLINPDGEIEWIEMMGGEMEDSGFGVDFSADGNILLTGQFQGDGDFGGLSITSMEDPTTGLPSLDIFIAKINLDGEVVFAKSGEAPYDDRGLDITSDPAGNIYLTGQFSDDIIFQTPHQNDVENAAFIMMFDDEGNEVWFRQLAALFVDCQDVQIGSDGEAILLGDFQGVFNVLSAPIEEFDIGYPNGVFVMSFDEEGDIGWFNSIGSNSPLSGISVDIDDSGDIYVGGTFNCVLDQYSDEYGPGLFNSTGHRDPFISKFSSGGEWLWARSYGSPKDNNVGGIAIKSADNPVLGGSFRDYMSVPANESFNDNEQWNVDLSAFHPNSNLTFCTYANYGTISSVESSGGRDLFLTQPFDSSLPHFDFYDRNNTPDCDYSVIDPCIENCEDPIEICAWQQIAVNSNSGWPGVTGPALLYAWQDGGTDIDTTITTDGSVMVEVARTDGCDASEIMVDIVQSEFIPFPFVTDDHEIHVNDQGFVLYFDLCAPNDITIDLDGLSDEVEWSHPELLIDENTLFVEQDITVTITQENEIGCVTENHLVIDFNGEPQDVDPELVLFEYVDGEFTIIEADTLTICPQVGFEIGIFDQITQSTSVTGANVIWTISPSASNTGNSTEAHFLPQTSGWYHIEADLNVSEFVECGEVQYPLMEYDVYINVIEVPDNEIVFNAPSELCPGDTILLTVSGGGDYTWIVIPTEAEIIAPDTILTPVGGTFKVESIVQSPEGCFNSTQDLFVINQIPNPPIVSNPPSAIVCPGEEVSLSVLEGISWQWISPDGAAISNNFNINVSTPGMYHCIVDLDNGCTLESEFIEVNMYQSPFLVPVPGNVFCDSDPIEINIQTNPEAEIQWLPPLDSNESTVILSDPGTYQVDVTLCGITNSLEISLSDSDLLSEITVGGDGTLCGNEPVILYANPGMAEYVWLPNEVYADSLVVFEPGEYILAATDSLGCTGLSDPVYIDDIPTNAPVASDTIICYNESVTLEAIGFGEIFWYTDPELDDLLSTGSSVTLENLMENQTLYIFQVEDDCASEVGEVDIVLSDASQPLDPSLSAPLCEGGTVILSVDETEGVSYEWTTSDNETSFGGILILENVTVDMSGEFLIHAWEDGCNGPTDTVQVLINQVIPPSITTVNSTICEGESADLYAESGYQFYEWFPNGELGEAINVSNAGDYWVEAVDDNGCASISEPLTLAVIEVLSPPSAQEVTLCYGDNATLNSTDGTTYLWQDSNFNPLDTASFLEVVNVTQSTAYYIQSFVSPECPSNPSVFSVTLEISGPDTDILGDQSYCEGESLFLSSSETGPTYTWVTPNGIVEEPNIEVEEVDITSAGEYQLIITSENCLAESDVIQVEVGTYPEFDLSSDFACEAGVLLFEVDASFDSYLWNGISGGNSFSTDQSGWIELIATNSPGCMTTQEYFVESVACPNNFPNVFSPGTDQHNDVVNFGLLSSKIKEVSIFNRWGNLVNLIEGSNLIWDGTTSRGDEASTGVYYYVVILDDSVSGLDKLSGHITLLR